MVLAVFVAILLNMMKLIRTGHLEGHIVQGNRSKIEDFSYAAFLYGECLSDGSVNNFICGGSILNHFSILTAGHCLDECEEGSNFTVHVGSVQRFAGLLHKVSEYDIHPDYSSRPISNDIAVMKLANSLMFGKTVKRLILMKEPPYFEPALVAGWGMTNETTHSHSKLLQHTSQTVWSRERCLLVLPRVPEGSFCAGSMEGPSYASFGDSGSALVVRQHIQIGLVSFKTTRVSRSLVVYTDVGYFYDWIRQQVKDLYCN